MLLAEDFRSETWKRLRRQLDAHLVTLRRRNDGPLDPIKTAALRGQIAEVNRMLALSPESASTEADLVE